LEITDLAAGSLRRPSGFTRDEVSRSFTLHRLKLLREGCWRARAC